MTTENKVIAFTILPENTDEVCDCSTPKKAMLQTYFKITGKKINLCAKGIEEEFMSWFLGKLRRGTVGS